MRLVYCSGLHRDYGWRTAAGLTLLLALSFCSSLHAQARRDPLSQLLYVEFSRDRLVKLEQMRGNPKTTERGRQTHDMLGDFLAIYDELNDNIDMYVGRKDDIRKPLKLVIEADTEFQSKLRALKNSENTGTDEIKEYEFLMTDALDTVDSSAEDHRKTVAEVEEYMKKKKKK
jgi:hypothetical protein